MSGMRMTVRDVGAHIVLVVVLTAHVMRVAVPVAHAAVLVMVRRAVMVHMARGHYHMGTCRRRSYHHARSAYGYVHIYRCLSCSHTAKQNEAGQ